MGGFEATVEAGGVLHVPYPEGTPVTVRPKRLSDYTREEWGALVDAVSGSIPDFQRPEPWPSRPAETLD